MGFAPSPLAAAAGAAINDDPLATRGAIRISITALTVSSRGAKRVNSSKGPDQLAAITLDPLAAIAVVDRLVSWTAITIKVK